jgi:flagellar basal body-associated protein FliL
MADFLNMNFDMTGIWAASSTFVGWVMIMVYALIAALVLWGLIYLLSFKNLVRVRQNTASGYVIIDTKAREFTTKDGVKKWRFLRGKWIKLSVIAPPTDFIEFTSKGKFSVECDRATDGTIHWRKRAGEPTAGDVFSSEERLITANEMRRANEYKKKGMMDTILQVALPLTFVIILVLIFAFYGDITKVGISAIQMGTDSNAKIAATCQSLFDKIDTCTCSYKNDTIVDTNGVNGLPNIPN